MDTKLSGEKRNSAAGPGGLKSQSTVDVIRTDVRLTDVRRTDVRRTDDDRLEQCANACVVIAVVETRSMHREGERNRPTQGACRGLFTDYIKLITSNVHVACLAGCQGRQ